MAVTLLHILVQQTQYATVVLQPYYAAAIRAKTNQLQVNPWPDLVFLGLGEFDTLAAAEGIPACWKDFRLGLSR